MASINPITPDQALQNRLTESQARIMSAVTDMYERQIEKSELQLVIEKELLMAVKFTERLVQLGATSAAQEVHHGH